MSQPPDLDEDAVTTLLFDADGTLFPSEEPAFDASARIVNAAMAELGVATHFSGTELRQAATGRNFRSIVRDLAEQHSVELSPSQLESWVEEELAAVTSHLRQTLLPDPRVRTALASLSARFHLVLVSSSASSRLAASLTATGLDDFFAEADRFSAQDSLPTPTSKPDPAIYRWARDVLGIAPEQGLAIEDAASGVLSARAAGFPVVGTLAFVAPDERDIRSEELTDAGAFRVVDDWDDLVGMLDPVRGRIDPAVAL